MEREFLGEGRGESGPRGVGLVEQAPILSLPPPGPPSVSWSPEFVQ